MSYSLPNGMTSAVFGPVSSRRNDCRILDWSGLDGSFRALNKHYLGIYDPDNMFKAYYDNGICGPGWDCHRSAHRGAPNAPLTLRQRQENSGMSAERITVEWSYDHVKTQWALIRNSNWGFKLEKDANSLHQQIRVMFFLTNCHTCL